MKKYDMLAIGHISLDYNIDYQDKLIVEVGGAVLHSSAAAYAGGHKAGAVTKFAAKDSSYLSDFALPREDIFYIPSERTTSIRNKYFTPDTERRNCTCISKAEGFTIDDMPAVESGIYCLAGLIYGDFDGELVKALSKRGKVAVDAQGFLRHAGGEGGDMYFEDWADKKEILPYITYFKTDAAEAEILTGKTDRAEAARMLVGWGAKEVCITHNTEVLAYDGREMRTCPLRPRNLSGRSGRGDTTFAAYITERATADMKSALLFAAAMVSNKMETPGPYRGSRADVTEYIKAFYSDIA